MSRTWWDRVREVVAPGAGSPRTSGRPPSANGASSFHLGWGLAGEFVEVSVTLEVLAPPTVPQLYFWALQADLAGAAGPAGGAHLGLQWHPRYPGSTAVNWGGYRAGGGELDGSVSSLPSRLGNVNTRDLAWSASTAYRLRVERIDEAGVAPPGACAFRGSVTAVATGVTTVVRDLHAPGDHIVGATMWSEVFADCDAPGVAVRWSDPLAVATDGSVVEPPGLSVNYQRHLDGGCANTVSEPDGSGIVQRTNADRSTPQGTRLPLR